MLDTPSDWTRPRLVGLTRQLLEKNSVSRPISLSTSLTEIGLSSIDMVNLMLAVEAEFDIQIPQFELTVDNCRSIESIERLVDRLKAR